MLEKAYQFLIQKKLFLHRNETEREYLYGMLGREPEAVDFEEITSLIEDCGTAAYRTGNFPRFPNPLFPGG